MADGAIRWQQDPPFYRRVALWNSGSGTADYTALQSWYRFFPMPGVGHCTGALGGGVGPSATDVFAALQNWVENGVAPASLTARGGTGAPATGRTRPLCPWPQTAIYNGTGSTDVASNFTCGGNLDANSNDNGHYHARYHQSDRALLDGSHALQSTKRNRPQTLPIPTLTSAKASSRLTPTTSLAQ